MCRYKLGKPVSQETAMNEKQLRSQVLACIEKGGTPVEEIVSSMKSNFSVVISPERVLQILDELEGGLCVKDLNGDRMVWTYTGVGEYMLLRQKKETPHLFERAAA